MNSHSILTERSRRILFTMLLILTLGVGACAGEKESSAQLGLGETYDAVRNGVRLALRYDARSSSFLGYVENTTDSTLRAVRVEVHLSNGVELGPTTPVDLDPGERRDVSLLATSQDFDGWTAHPEVGKGREHGGGEGDSEHGGKGGGEHGGGGAP